MSDASSHRFAVKEYIGRALRPQDSFDYLIAVFFAFLLVIFWGVTHLDLYDGHFETTSPHVITGDEPHYLLVINSILFDHDLELQDDYERARYGPDAGDIPLPDHHTILVNRRTGKHGVWFENYQNPELAPGPDVYEVSAHPVAYPAFLAGLIAPFFPRMEDVQGDASLVMVVICWLGAILTFRLARQVGMGRGLALMTTALLVFASPWLAYARSFFAEPVVGLAAVAALLALESDRPLLAAFCAAMAGLFKPSMEVIGAGFVIGRLFEKQWSQAIKMSIVLGIVGVGLIAFNYWLARTPVIAGTWSGPWPLGNNTATDFRQLTDNFFGSEHGLFVWCPWTIFAIFPIALAFCCPSQAPKVAREMALPMLLQLILLSSWSIGPGISYGPRHWIPFLPWMAVAAVTTVRSSKLTWQLVFGVAAAFSIAISILGALRYPQLYARSPWYLFAQPAANVEMLRLPTKP
jgi:hypothetical protein